MMRFIQTCLILILLPVLAGAAIRQDSLRGSNGAGRNWWDVRHYDLTVAIDLEKKSISGTNTITLLVTDTPGDSIQLDLQEPMILDEATLEGRPLLFSREGNVYWLRVPSSLKSGLTVHLECSFHGTPRVAVRPPWDGGLIWTKDASGLPWVAVACQGLGASAWWPCKDYQGDEPDNGVTFFLDHENPNQVVSNGRLSSRDTIKIQDPVTGQIERLITSDSLAWKSRNPINTYDVTFYLGDYVSWTDTLMGEKGKLDLSFYCLRQNEEKARKQFTVAKQMLHCFEWWLGPYPFYEDGYKLVEAPYLGMEHQSAVAYGNKYKMGYMGTDRSGTGVGMAFDYIIIHESGHEWFGNSITARDIADNWLHEGFTTYTETLFAEWILGKEKARRYNIGERRNIDNDRPIIGKYGVNDDGSGDKYDKGSAILHMIRTMMADDEAFRQTLRGLSDTFYHKIISTADVENYISRRAARNLTPFFDQYLRTAQIPVLEWNRKGGKLYYRFGNTVPGFTLPIPVEGRNSQTLEVSTEWSSIAWKGKAPRFAADFLIQTRETKTSN